MSDDLTISAQRWAAVWCEPDGCTMARWTLERLGENAGGYFARNDSVLDLSDPQTAFGVALRLDEWERAGDGARHYWAGKLADEVAWPAQRTKVLAAMIARLIHIGLDHRIRRALGEAASPGTLATLERVGNCWRLDSRQHGVGGVMIEWSAYPGDGGCTLGMCGTGSECPPGYVSVPALEGVTDPDEALVAIAATLDER